MLSWVNCILIAVLILTRPGDLFNARVVHSPTYLFIYCFFFGRGWAPKYPGFTSVALLQCETAERAGPSRLRGCLRRCDIHWRRDEYV